VVAVAVGGVGRRAQGCCKEGHVEALKQLGGAPRARTAVRTELAGRATQRRRRRAADTAADNAIWQAHFAGSDPGVKLPPPGAVLRRRELNFQRARRQQRLGGGGGSGGLGLLPAPPRLALLLRWDLLRLGLLKGAAADGVGTLEEGHEARAVVEPDGRRRCRCAEVWVPARVEGHVLVPARRGAE